ncbi:uncharacterized protein LOC114730595 [Neltuma alba]|uniref:uncharacterized protein LOC114730595 n=1 Tax=Neltuma alba TaxID=207710 RepID=UPI0010A31155|nr:uncharacterized protein LOC114730595 [Prosopis alba]
MKTIPSQSESNTGSTNSSVVENHDRSTENRDSCYYPDCLKDANCDCKFCLESYATLDRVPVSIQKSSLTKLSASRPNVEHTPISFDVSILSTPTSNASHNSPPLAVKSDARVNLDEKMKNEKKREWDFSGVKLFRLVLGLCFILSAEVAFTLLVSGIFRPVLSPDVMKRIGEKSSVVQDLNGKFRFLQKELQDIVNGKVQNCSYGNSVWEISQNGVLLNSRCTLYKSAAEEVAIWGWPLQTAGLLTTGFSSRTFTILSGRVTEWNAGQVGYLIRKANASWVQPKWGASVVQLDSSTWVLEYKRRFVFDSTRLYSAALEFFKHRISRMAGTVKKEFWLFAAFGDHQYTELTANYGTKMPT